ncbi:MAG TPA: RES domain-containing protein, partial [Burkholderiaceae bacterium]
VCVHECRVSAEDELFVATLKATKELRLLNLSALLKEDIAVTEFESLDMAVYMLFLAGKHSYGIAQAIAAAAEADGFDGLVYPSYFSMLRTGAVPFETAYGISSRRMTSRHDYEQSKAVPNLAIFGRPVKDGRVKVTCIDRLVLQRVKYDFHFGPADIAYPA